MQGFRYVQGALHCEEVPVEEIARENGTPCYVYSSGAILDRYGTLRGAFGPAARGGAEPLIAYSVKANSGLSILRLLHDCGSGFDVVSGGELFRALRAGADPGKIVFAGVGKTEEEFRFALESGVLLLNVESEPELEALDRIAGSMKRKARAALRVNPDVDPRTHTYIATGRAGDKFGVDLARASRLFERSADFPNVELCGVHFHVGSQIASPRPYVEALRRVEEFVGGGRDRLEWLDIGGGFGIRYRDEEAPDAADMAAAMMPHLDRLGLKLILEPGRFIVGNAGILVTRVLYVKESGPRRFCVCDAGMNDLIRPTLYGAYHRVWPVRAPDGCEGEAAPAGGDVAVDVVGPVCETGDFFAQGRALPLLGAGDLLAVFGAGAYGRTMASNYNSRLRAAEVIVAGAGAWRTTDRETFEDLVRGERIVAFPRGGSLRNL